MDVNIPSITAGSVEVEGGESTQVPNDVWEAAQEVVALSRRAIYGHRVRPALREALATLDTAVSGHDGT